MGWVARLSRGTSLTRNRDETGSGNALKSGPMNGGETVSPGGTSVASNDGIPVPVVDGVSRGRRRRRTHRHKTLGEKLKRHQTANRMRRIVAILFLGAIIIGLSMFMAHQANDYVPVPTYPAP
jgi:hypothetical protein